MAAAYDYHEGARDGAALIFNRYLARGVYPSLATTASTQGAGALGVASIRVNETAGLLRMPAIVPEIERGNLWETDDDGVVAQRAATADVLLHNAAVLCLQTQERRITRVAWFDVANGAIAYANVLGDAAADGASVEATDAQILAALGNVNFPWMRLYDVLVRRTADVVLVLTYDFTRRPLGVQGRNEILTAAV